MNSEWVDDGRRIFRESDDFALVRKVRNGFERILLVSLGDTSPTYGGACVRVDNIDDGKTMIDMINIAKRRGDNRLVHMLMTMGD